MAASVSGPMLMMGAAKESAVPTDPILVSIVHKGRLINLPCRTFGIACCVLLPTLPTAAVGPCNIEGGLDRFKSSGEEPIFWIANARARSPRVSGRQRQRMCPLPSVDSRGKWESPPREIGLPCATKID